MPLNSTQANENSQTTDKGALALGVGVGGCAIRAVAKGALEAMARTTPSTWGVGSTVGWVSDRSRRQAEASSAILKKPRWYQISPPTLCAYGSRDLYLQQLDVSEV